MIRLLKLLNKLILIVQIYWIFSNGLNHGTISALQKKRDTFQMKFQIKITTKKLLTNQKLLMGSRTKQSLRRTKTQKYAICQTKLKLRPPLLIISSISRLTLNKRVIQSKRQKNSRKTPLNMRRLFKFSLFKAKPQPILLFFSLTQFFLSSKIQSFLIN